MAEPLAGNFNDDDFRPQKVQVAPDVIGQKSANGAVGHSYKLFLQDRTDAERADHPLKGILRVCEAPLFFDENIHADLLFAVVVGHASTCIAVIPSRSKKSIGIWEKSWSNHTIKLRVCYACNFLLEFLSILRTGWVSYGRRAHAKERIRSGREAS